VLYMLTCFKAVRDKLGTVAKISAPDSKSFFDEISQYVESRSASTGKRNKQKGKKGRKNASTLSSEPSQSSVAEGDCAKEEPSDEHALWPLIRLVRIRCNAKALETGAVLVDLPGVADANAARNTIAKEYMKVAMRFSEFRMC
jgi:hypothetical protein